MFYFSVMPFVFFSNHMNIIILSKWNLSGNFIEKNREKFLNSKSIFPYSCIRDMIIYGLCPK